MPPQIVEALHHFCSYSLASVSLPPFTGTETLVSYQRKLTFSLPFLPFFVSESSAVLKYLSSISLFRDHSPKMIALTSQEFCSIDQQSDDEYISASTRWSPAELDNALQGWSRASWLLSLSFLDHTYIPIIHSWWNFD